MWISFQNHILEHIWFPVVLHSFEAIESRSIIADKIITPFQLPLKNVPRSDQKHAFFSEIPIFSQKWKLDVFIYSIFIPKSILQNALAGQALGLKKEEEPGASQESIF